jgi:hypothetical protein
MLTVQHFIGGAHDGVRFVGGKQAERAVDSGGGTLYLGEGGHQFRRHALGGDGEMLERTLGLRAPQAAGWNIDGAETVFLASRFHCSILICGSI